MEQGPEQLAGVDEGEILAGKYRVERIVGTGGMGVVVAARHIELDSRVAIKFLLPAFLSNQEAVSRFAREARAAVKIQNEHVARVADVGTLPNGAPYMVMDYLEGEDLAAWLELRGPLPIDQAVEFILQACVAVADAHALGIVHRDLKPANLFCVRRTDGQLTIKVLDFGISKVNDPSGLSSGSVTRTSAMMGSPAYMAPEQLRSAKDVDGRTDIWGLGIILFELLTGRQAFVADSVSALTIKIVTEPTPSARSLRPDLPPELDAILSKCLEKDRALRYANVAELGIALLPFAPTRAKAFVDRISGIIRAAGLATSVLVVPPSGPPPDPTGFTGTLPGIGAARPAAAGRRMAYAWGLVAGGVVLALLGAAAVAAMRTAAKREGPVAAAAPSTTLSQPERAFDPPKSDDAASSDATPVVLAPVTPEPPAGLPHGTLPTRTTPQRPGRPATTPAAAQPAGPMSPSTVRCDPPYFFDAKGNRVFKKECL
ncbi:MAG: serine/threonine-protein kinase [Polyangiaceae bacterium]|jgi:serine/threonine-protein kinase